MLFLKNISSIAAVAMNNNGESEGLTRNEILLIVFTIIFVIAVVFLIVKRKLSQAKILFASVVAGVRALFLGSTASNTDVDALNQIIADGGYSYDAKQDIFFSNMDAWQRDFGYCRLYDEAAAVMGMIIDCEPIAFEYDGKRWLIEFWKGQYDLLTGCEVGVYSTEGPNLNIPGVFNGTFYYCADDTDLLQISFSLIKNKKAIIKRDEKHWWLTGFMLGEFSNPNDLTMQIRITLKDEIMRDAFVTALKSVGYINKEMTVKGNVVRLTFSQAHVTQPYTRVKKAEYMIQWKNRYLCDRYKDITRAYTTMPEKLEAVREQAPETYKNILDMGKPKKIFENYQSIEKYLN